MKGKPLPRHTRKLTVLAMATVSALAGSMVLMPQPAFADIDTFNVVNRVDRLCLTRESSGDPWITEPCASDNRLLRQIFILDGENLGEVLIRQAGRDDCVGQDVPRSDLIVASCDRSGLSARWEAIPTDGGYRFKNLASGDFLDGAGTGIFAGRERGLIPDESRRSQIWDMPFRFRLPTR